MEASEPHAGMLGADGVRVKMMTGKVCADPGLRQPMTSPRDGSQRIAEVR